jgi:hypothetical protein
MFPSSPQVACCSKYAERTVRGCSLKTIPYAIQQRHPELLLLRKARALQFAHKHVLWLQTEDAPSRMTQRVWHVCIISENAYTLPAAAPDKISEASVVQTETIRRLQARSPQLIGVACVLCFVVPCARRVVRGVLC